MMIRVSSRLLKFPPIDKYDSIMLMANFWQPSIENRFVASVNIIELVLCLYRPSLISHYFRECLKIIFVKNLKVNRISLSVMKELKSKKNILSNFYTYFPVAEREVNATKLRILRLAFL